MRKYLLRVLLFASALAAPSAAFALQAGDWYAGVGGTVSLREDVEGTVANAPTPGSTVRTHNEIEPGWGGMASVGRDFGRFRLEAELGYTRETQDRSTALTPATGEMFVDVEETQVRAMANAFVDFELGPIEPFVGVGVGMAKTDVLFIGPRAPFPTEQPRKLIDDSDESFAYQVMAGAAVPLNDRTALTLQYRWFDSGDFEGVDVRREKITRDHAGHNIDVGLRVAF